MDKVREEFEAWASRRWKDGSQQVRYKRDMIQKDDPGYLEYCNTKLQAAWESWQAAYEAGRNASRRPLAMVKTFAKHQAVYSGGDLVRGGFDSVSEARDWAQSNGFEVYP